MPAQAGDDHGQHLSAYCPGLRPVTRPAWQRLMLVVSLVLVAVATVGSVVAMIRVVLFNG